MLIPEHSRSASQKELFRKFACILHMSMQLRSLLMLTPDPSNPRDLSTIWQFLSKANSGALEPRIAISIAQ
jgi:hypothetical protein